MKAQIETRKVFKLLSTLHSRERKKLDRWLAYEISEKQVEVLYLYELIKARACPRKIWERLFPDRTMPDDPFQDNQFRRLENHLTTRIEKFLAIQAFLLDDSQRDLYLIKALNQRTPQDIFPTEFRKIWKRAEKQPVRDASYYRLLFELEKENQFFQLKHRRGKKAPSREFYHNMLEAWWLHEKLRMEILNLNDQTVNQSPGHIHLLESVFELIEENPLFAEMPVIGIYLRLYKLLAFGDENRELLEHLWLYSDYMEPSERKDVFTLILNYYVRKSFESKEVFYREQLYLLYDWGLGKGLLFRDGFLLWRAYRGIFDLKLEFEDFDSTLHFLEEYKNHVPKLDREEVYSFCMGRLHFKRKEFRQALRYFLPRFRHLSNEISARLWLIRTRYELGNRVELENDLRAFRMYMDRKTTVDAMVKANVQNSLHFIDQLIRLYRPEELEKLRNQIQAADTLSNQEWFLEKVAEIMQSHKKKKPE